MGWLRWLATRWLATRWQVVVAVGCGGVAAAVLAGMLHITEFDYGDAQVASDRARFDAVVDGRVTEFTWAAVLDCVFVVAYVGLAAALGLQPDRGRWRRRTGYLGFSLVAVAGALDLIENLIVLKGLHSSSWTAVNDAMVWVGRVKFVFAGWGATLLLVAALTPVVRRTARALRDWLAVAWPSYAAFVASMLISTALLTRWWGWGLVGMCAGLLILSSVWVRWETVKDRAEENVHARGRVALGIVQLIGGIALVVLAWNASFPWSDMAAVAGLALTAIAPATLASEARRSSRGARWRGPALLVVAGGVVAVAPQVDGSSWALGVAGMGVLIGWIGFELSSEDLSGLDLDAPAPLNARTGVAFLAGHREKLFGGLVLTALAVALLATYMDAHWKTILIVVVAVSVLLAFALSESDATVVGLALLAVLFWAATPGSVASDPNLQPVGEDSYMLVLGDSYISGEGSTEYLEGTNSLSRGNDADPGQDCRQAPHAWPFLIADANRKADESDGAGKVPTAPTSPAEDVSKVLFLACSGAISEDISVHQARLDAPAQLQQFNALKDEHGLDDPAFVVLMVGGNDAGFGGIVARCLAPGDCSDLGGPSAGPETPGERATRRAEAESREPRVDNPHVLAKPARDVGRDVTLALDRIRRQVGDVAPIVVVGYPRPVSTADEGDGLCPGAHITPNERRFVNDFVDVLNSTISEAVADAKRSDRGPVAFLDGSDSLHNTGMRLCETAAGQAGLNFLDFRSVGGDVREIVHPGNWVHNSVHPNKRGHEAIACHVRAWLPRTLAEAAGTAPDQRPPAPKTADCTAFSLGESATVSRGSRPSVPRLTRCDRLAEDAARSAANEACTDNPDGWPEAQIRDLAKTSVGPMLLLIAGLGLLLSPVVWLGRWCIATSGWAIVPGTSPRP